MIILNISSLEVLQCFCYWLSHVHNALNLASSVLFSSFPPAKRIGRKSSWDDFCEATSSPVVRVACLHFSRFSIIPFSLLSLRKACGPNVWGFLNCTVVLYLYHRYLPAEMELFWGLLLLHKSCMRLVADRWVKLFYDEFQFGNGSQSRRKCLHSTPSQRREILDWTQWPKCGGLLCVDKQRNKQI